MNVVVKIKSLKGEGSLLPLLLLTEKKSEGRDLKLERIWIGTPLHYEGT